MLLSQFCSSGTIPCVRREAGGEAPVTVPCAGPRGQRCNLPSALHRARRDGPDRPEQSKGRLENSVSRPRFSSVVYFSGIASEILRMLLSPASSIPCPKARGHGGAGRTCSGAGLEQRSPGSPGLSALPAGLRRVNPFPAQGADSAAAGARGEETGNGGWRKDREQRMEKGQGTGFSPLWPLAGLFSSHVCSFPRHSPSGWVGHGSRDTVPRRGHGRVRAAAAAPAGTTSFLPSFLRACLPLGRGNLAPWLLTRPLRVCQMRQILNSSRPSPYSECYPKLLGEYCLRQMNYLMCGTAWRKQYI
nr:uncharacterized protein LOC106629591 [Zonotrichia albicollis]